MLILFEEMSMFLFGRMKGMLRWTGVFVMIRTKIVPTPLEGNPLD